MPDIFGTILWPIKWVVEAILVAFHTVLCGVGMNPDDGLTWVLSIFGLVFVVRAALIPIFVRQIKSQRRMLKVAPQTMEHHERTGKKSLSSWLPFLLHMVIFFSLFSVLQNAQHELVGIGLLNKELSISFGEAEFFGAPLKDSISSASGSSQALVIAMGVIMVVLMTASQFITQLQIMSKNQSPEMKANPTFRQQRILPYILPLAFTFSGFTLPLGVMFYWFIANFYTVSQAAELITALPTPRKPRL